MSKFHTTISQWGLVSGIRQTHSDMIVVSAPRSPFSPDARKGQLVLVVEAEGDVARGRQACALVAQKIREAFYADGSMSITSSLRHALKAANAALYQHNFSAPPHKRAHVGVTCAVIHGTDVFVTQVPPSQAFIAHAGKLRALPVPPSWTNGLDVTATHRQGSLGTSLGSEPEFFRSVMQPGDTLVLCSSNVVRLLGKHEAEQLICYADAASIAEDLYGLCRAANLPEAHAIVIEAVPGAAPEVHDQPSQPAGLPEPQAEHGAVTSRLGGWLGRGSRGAKSRSNGSALPSGETAAVLQEQAVAAVAPAPASNGQTSAPLTLMDMLPVADVMPLPPSAFLGEGDYGGMVRPPAVPRRNRQIDLSDNTGMPVDFAALPRKPAVPPPTMGDRMLMPVHALFATFMGGLANVPRRTARPAEPKPAQGLRLKGLSYRRQRPPLPWLNIILIVGVVALLIAVGIYQNRRSDQQTIDTALDKVTSAVAAARAADDPQVAQQQLTAAESLLNGEVGVLVESGRITTTKQAVWARYESVRTDYDRALAEINKIGIVDNFTTVATLPGGQGLIERVVLGTTESISDTNPPLFYLDRASGVLYERGQQEPVLKPDQEISAFVADPIREALWREGNIIAFDRGDVSTPIYRVFLRSGGEWLGSQLNQTEWMEPADGNLPMATYGGNLYVWDSKEKQIWKYTSGMYADLPASWITNGGGKPLDQVADIQVEGLVYLLNRDASVLVFEAGQLIKEFPAPQLAVPATTVSRFVVTPDILDVDGVTVLRPGSIYILDTRNERVLQLSKTDGALIQQIQARARGPLNQISDLAVDEPRGMIYLANGPRVLRTALPEPPQPSAEPSATETTETATPEP
ncbi:MAG TPA: hypothetical protein VGD58_30200 [Herpetosiphonaceae bacterium]